MSPGSGRESASGSLARPPAAHAIVPNARWPIVAFVEQNRPDDPDIPWVPLWWHVQLRPDMSSIRIEQPGRLDFQLGQFAIRLIAPIPARVGIVGRIRPDQIIDYRVVWRPGTTPTRHELAAALEDLHLIAFQRPRANQVMDPQELLGWLQYGLDAAYRLRNSRDANWWTLRAVLRHMQISRAHVNRGLQRYGWTWSDVRDVLRPTVEKQETKTRVVLFHHEQQHAREELTQCQDFRSPSTRAT